MTERNDSKETRAPTHVVRLPGFLLEKEIGLGDVIKKVTYSIGIPPCGACERRAGLLNRWLHFTK